MPAEVLMPRLSEDVEEGVLVTWFVEPGAVIADGDLVAEIQVEKVSQEVYAPAGGTVLDLRVEPGGTVAQGAVIALIGAPGEAVPPGPEEAPPDRIPAPFNGSRPLAAAGPGPASPAARRLARELGVDLAAVHGTGPGGRIVEDDVRQAARLTAASLPGHSLSPTREVIADHLRGWLGATAQFTITAEADVTALTGALEARGGTAEPATHVDAVVRACALALRDHPRLGSRWIAERIVEPDSIDIGVAVALDDGLVAPVVRQADHKSVGLIHREVAELAERARSGQLTLSETRSGVFSVTNLGAYRIDAFTPLLDPPQTAILGLGRARPRPAVVDGKIEPRTLMVLSLTVDHQVIDGAPAAAFLADVVGRLEDPATVLAAVTSTG